MPGLEWNPSFVPHKGMRGPEGFFCGFFLLSGARDRFYGCPAHAFKPGPARFAVLPATFWHRQPPGPRADSSAVMPPKRKTHLDQLRPSAGHGPSSGAEAHRPPGSVPRAASERCGPCHSSSEKRRLGRIRRLLRGARAGPWSIRICRIAWAAMPRKCEAGSGYSGWFFAHQTKVGLMEPERSAAAVCSLRSLAKVVAGRACAARHRSQEWTWVQSKLHRLWQSPEVAWVIGSVACITVINSLEEG